MPTKKNEEIEVIDIFDEDREIGTKKEEEQIKEKSSKIVKRKLKKGLLFQVIFCTFSIIFIIGCCIFYGSRLVKYYKIYNPKDENGKAISLIGNHITSKTSFVYEGEGLYLINGTYLYKGNEVNNYIKFSNLNWRILKINEDKSLDIILDNSINNLKWNSKITNYTDSDINKYLNTEFLSILNKSLMTNTNICNDIIDDINKISCNKPDASNMVRLLSVDEFLNSKVDEKTYISNGNSVWLSSRGSEKAWTINNLSLSYSEVENAYDIKPVVTLKNTNQVIKGTGTKEDPFIIEEETSSLKVGDHIKLDKDVWTVYKIEKDNLYLSLTSLYENGSKTYRFDLKSNKYNPENKYSLAEYLNKDYYESLSYKKLLLEVEWNIGEYKDSYKDIYDEKVKAKVGLSSIEDFKLDNVNNYYLLNGSEEGKIYLYNEGIVESKTTLARSIKPSICINKANIKNGTGTLEDPYNLEV